MREERDEVRRGGKINKTFVYTHASQCSAGFAPSTNCHRARMNRETDSISDHLIYENNFYAQST